MPRFHAPQTVAAAPSVGDDIVPPEPEDAGVARLAQAAANRRKLHIATTWDDAPTTATPAPAATSASVREEDLAEYKPEETQVDVMSAPSTSRGSDASLHQDAKLFIRGVLGEAVRRGASDVHFEPHTDRYTIRFRIDGVLREYVARPYDEYAAMLNTIKVLADTDIAERSIPQDGHIELALEQVSENQVGHEGKTLSHVYDIRVSIFPSVDGEVIVMRLLNRADALLSLEDIGMDVSSLETLREMLVSAFGMFLITGPTGSGKTTTLYSILQELRSKEKNMITLEDPIEFHLDWLRQCEIRESRGFTFERAMSSVLRQDPDVLMVGEIRDAKTAEYAIRSALVGSLVGSTIHANTATGTIARLLDLGIPRSILAHALTGIIAQRLVRRVCSSCREEYDPPHFYKAHFGLDQMPGPFIRGRGCDRCNGTGYFGRMGVYSVMRISDTLRSMVFEQRSLIDIQAQAISEGMRTLKMDAASKIMKGFTTAEEAARVI